MRTPDFVVVGSPRCGTTSLFFYLKQHPEIFLPQRKELHFFSYDLLARNANGPGDRDVLRSLCASEAEYLQCFDEAKPRQVVGEISPSYLYYASVVSRRIYEKLRPVKIVILLRNPIEKAFSQYQHLVQEGRETLSFFEALMQEKRRKELMWGDIWLYAESSLFAENVRTFLSIFGWQNVKVIIGEQLFASPRLVLQDLLQFLEVNPAVEIDPSNVYNRSGQVRLPVMARLISQESLIKRAGRRMLPGALRFRLRLLLQDLNTGRKPEIDAESRAFLRDFFHQDVRKLETILEESTGWRLE